MLAGQRRSLYAGKYETGVDSVQAVSCTGLGWA